MDAVFETPDVPKKTGWRETVEAVDAMTDLDALTELHATETRKRVLKAIEARMEALNGG